MFTWDDNTAGRRLSCYTVLASVVPFFFIFITKVNLPVKNDLFIYLIIENTERRRDREISHLLVHSPIGHKAGIG